TTSCAASGSRSMASARRYSPLAWSSNSDVTVGTGASAAISLTCWVEGYVATSPDALTLIQRSRKGVCDTLSISDLGLKIADFWILDCRLRLRTVDCDCRLPIADSASATVRCGFGICIARGRSLDSFGPGLVF